jgi:5-methylcytosine-specific restriction protein A
LGADRSTFPQIVGANWPHDRRWRRCLDRLAFLNTIHTSAAVLPWSAAMPSKPRSHNPRPSTLPAHRPSDDRISASRRGYGRRWRDQTRTAFLREHPLCEDCYRRGIIMPATDVDHIVAKRRGGTDQWRNLQALCHSCHSRKTAREDRGNSLDQGGVKSLGP